MRARTASLGLTALLVAAGCDQREADCKKFSAAWNAAHGGPLNSAAEVKVSIDARRIALGAVVSKDVKLRSLWSEQLAINEPSVSYHQAYEAATSKTGQITPAQMQALEERNRQLAAMGAKGQEKLIQINDYCAK